MKTATFAFVCLAAAGFCGVASAQWGDFTATFTVTGAAPKLPKLALKDQFCIDAGTKDPTLLQDETYVLGAKGELKNVIVSLVPEKAGTAIKVHPDYEKTAKEKILLDNKNCRFEPRITIVRTSQTLTVGNSDPVGHNSNFACFANPPVNPLIPAKGSQDLTFKLAEKSPIPVTCNIHPWMKASVLIKEDPYAAVSDATGTVTIKNIPAGKWQMHIWHEGPGNIVAATEGGKKVEWKRGRAPVEIADGKTVTWAVSLTPEQITPKK